MNSIILSSITKILYANPSIWKMNDKPNITKARIKDQIDSVHSLKTSLWRESRNISLLQRSHKLHLESQHINCKIQIFCIEMKIFTFLYKFDGQAQHHVNRY